jgi:hypothetical protein
VDRGGWDDEAIAGRLAGSRAGVCGGQKKGGVDRGPQREACMQHHVLMPQLAVYGRTLINFWLSAGVSVVGRSNMRCGPPMAGVLFFKYSNI